MEEEQLSLEPQMPEVSDQLFRPFNDDYRHNAIIRTGIRQFFLFSDAYMTAALKLFEQLDGSAYYANTLVYPIVFTCRHFLELRLKELISGLNYAKSQEYSFDKHHRLYDLWSTYRKLHASMGVDTSPEDKTFDAVDKLIKEFATTDPVSFSFRYPVDKEENPTLKIETLDLDNFRTVMDKLFNFFSNQSDHVFYFIDMADEYYTYMADMYYQEMRGY